MSDPIPVDQLRNIRSIMELAVSPDGSRVAFVASEYDGTDNETHTSLFTVPSDGSEAPYRLTRVSGASSPKWSPDGSNLAFLASRDEDVERKVGLEPDEAEDTDGEEADVAVDAADEDDEAESDEGNESENDEGNESETDDGDEPETQVWAFDVRRGGDARQLTDREYGVREFDWGPDGKRIVISARDPTEEQAAYLARREDDGPIEIERLQHKADGVGYTDDVTTYLFVVDLETGDERRLDGAFGAGAYEPLSGLEPTWHPEAETIAFLTTDADRPDDTAVRNVFTVDVRTGEVSKLTDLECTLYGPAWAPNGDRLTVSARDASNWYLPADVLTIDLETGAHCTLTEGLTATVSWSGAPQFTDDETVLAGMGDEGWTRLYRFPADRSDPEALSIGPDVDQSLRLFDVAGGTLAYTVTDPADGHDIYVTSADSLASDGIRLTEMNRTFVETYPMPAVRRLETESDDVTVESIVYCPESFDPDDPEPHPTILWMHGGPMSYDDPEFAFSFAYFVSRGYVVCKPNYRGSTSYGRAFAEVLRGRWGTVEVDDMLAVAEDLVERGWVDEDRQFAMGFSYGGIATGYLITQSNRFTAAAAEHGIYDLRSEFGTSDSQVWTGDEFGLPWEHPENYEAGSSITDVGNVETPTLITAGGRDWRCPPTQSEQLYVSLRKQDVPAKLVVYPEEHHNIGRPERAIHRLETIADWFETHDPTVETGTDDNE